MHTKLKKLLLAFLIAWLPVSLAQAAALHCPASADHAPTMQNMQLVQENHHPATNHQQHIHHHDCHACGLCYTCAASASPIVALNLPLTESLVSVESALLISFIPEQPERPPRA